MGNFTRVKKKVDSLETLLYEIDEEETKPSILINTLLTNTSLSDSLKIDIWHESVDDVPIVRTYIAKDLVLTKEDNHTYELPAKSLTLLPGDSLRASAYTSGGIPLFTGEASWETFNWQDFSWNTIETSGDNPYTVDVYISIYEN